jgi:hypothetical protein
MKLIVKFIMNKIGQICFLLGMQYDESDIPIVYVDGVCAGLGKPSAKGGIGVFFNDKNA